MRSRKTSLFHHSGYIFCKPLPGSRYFCADLRQVFVQLLHSGHDFPVPGLPFWIPTTFLLPFGIARRQKGTHGGLIGAERTRRNPKRGPEGSKKGVPMSQIGSIWYECRQVKNDCHASKVLVIGGRPKAAQEHWFGWQPKAAFIDLSWRCMAGGQRPP